MTQRQQRAIRGILAATLAVFVAALFHLAGGGGAPTPLGLGASVVLAAPACVLLAGRRTGLVRLTVSITLAQFAFHLLFGLGRPSDVRFSGDTGMAGMAGMRLHVVGTGGGASVSLAAPAMWVGHALAALVTIAAIRHGEQALRRMLELAARFLVRALLLARPRPLPGAPALARLCEPAALRPRVLHGCGQHRGPPALLHLTSY